MVQSSTEPAETPIGHPSRESVEQKLKDHRESAVRLMAILMCRAACIEPIDSGDGSSNWWIFAKEAEAVIDDIQKRFPPPPLEVFGVVEASAVPDDR